MTVIFWSAFALGALVVTVMGLTISSTDYELAEQGSGLEQEPSNGR